MASLSPLIGRAEELGLVEKLVQEHRLVTVTGAAGVGKTRLVEELRVQLAAAGDRVIAVRLDDLPAGAGAEAIAGEAGMASPEALALASTGERILVVLDGCDHVLAGAVDLALRFCGATDAGAVLTTSRQPLGVAGERVVVLDPLGVPTPADPDPAAAPAVALFFELVTASDARWDRSDRTVQAVAELCRAVDGLPLAIELAAARARTLSPAELLALVTQRTDTLRPPGGARSGGPPSIDSSIALSVQLLDDDQREVFRRLGVLTGPFDLGLVHAAAGPVVDDHLRAVELVGALVDRSLVVAEPSTTSTRYRMLQVVREHALADLTAAGLADETREHLASAMVAEATDILVEGSQRWSGELIARITTRAASFIASLEWCIAHDDDPGRAYALFVPLFAPAQQKAADVQAIGSALFARWPATPAPLRAEALAVSATAHVLGYDLDAAAGAGRGGPRRPRRHADRHRAGGAGAHPGRHRPGRRRRGAGARPARAGGGRRRPDAALRTGAARLRGRARRPRRRRRRGRRPRRGGHRRLPSRGRPAHRDLGAPGGGDHRHPRRPGGRGRAAARPRPAAGRRHRRRVVGRSPCPLARPARRPPTRPTTVGERPVPCGAAPSSGALASATWASSPSPSPPRPRRPRRTATPTTPPPCCERRRTCPPSPCCPRCTPTACATCLRTTTARGRWCRPSGRRSPS